VSPGLRSGALSALGPVGGTVASPAGMFGLEVRGAVGAGVAGATVAGATTVGATDGGAATAGLGGCGAGVDFASRAGFLHTFDEKPKAGTAAGGEEGRGA
jgi:hypothetical protein